MTVEEYNSLGKEIESLLILRYSPIALKLLYSEDEISAMYPQNIKVVGTIPFALSAAMGNTYFLATFKTEEEMNAFYVEVLKERN